MATVSPISSGSVSYSIAGDVPTPTRTPQKTLGQNDFLKLLAAQFKVQDPLKPMEDTAFIAQMAQFTSLEQSSTMTKELTALRADQQRVVANSYLGHRVTVDAGNGDIVTADVSAVDATGTAPRLVVDGKTYPLSAVLRVEPTTVSSQTPQSAGAGAN